MSKSPKHDETELPVEKSLALLQEIVDQLESGKLDLDASFGRFEEAVKLSKALKKKLDGYERRIELIRKVDGEGIAESEIFDEKSRNT